MKQKGSKVSGTKHINFRGQPVNPMERAARLLESTVPYWLPMHGYSTAKIPFDLLSRWQSPQLGHWEINYDIQEELANISEQLDELSGDIYSIKGELDKCKKSVSELHEKLESRPIVKQTNIAEISDDFRVKIPIPVTIEEYDDGVTASVAEIQLFATGATEAEALLRLKREIVSLYDELSETPREQLGNLLIRYLRVLGKLVEKNG